MKNLKLCLFLLLFIAVLLPAKVNKVIKTANSNRKVQFYFDFLSGYGIPINASYIDTIENDDIYWNPNSGFKLDTRITIKFNEIFYFALPLDIAIGFTRYETTDGRKVNTEAQAGNTPETMNNEWSIVPNFVPLFMAKFAKHPAVPYIGIGIGLGLMWSFESWDFTNDDDDAVLLIIAKQYWPAPTFKGELGWYIPLKNNFNFRIAGIFNLSNFIMRRVDLTHYYVNGANQIKEYDEVSTVYNYSFDSPDENKGGDCLLAGFVYQNYPQEKISTNFSIEIGFAYNF